LNIDQVRKIRMINRILSNCHNFWHGDWLSSGVFGQMVEISQGPDCVYCFWIGFPLSTQLHVLSLCASCTSVCRLAVFKDTKWRKAEQGIFWHNCN
jgi:hypothetical protein